MATPRLQDGDVGFVSMDSATDPEQLGPGVFSRSYNTLARGRNVQCRPGYTWRLNLPSGQVQGLTMFRAADGSEQIVFAVAGKVYFSAAPFDTYTQISGIDFDPYTPFVYFAECEQGVEINADGSLRIVTPARPLLVMQTGVNAAAVWDGATASQEPGEIPLGTVMKWSGGRLWIARGRIVYASDYANPRGYTEALYLGGVPYLAFPGQVTALAETPSVSDPALIVFTESTSTLVLSNVRNRTLWPNVEKFQQTILSTVGCVAHRSIVQTNGLLWWYSSQGLTRLDVAAQTQLSAGLPWVDYPMAASKAYLSPDRAPIAGGVFERYAFWSVPYASLSNEHTWVFDTTTQAWQSIWTGTRPMQWVSGTIARRERVFFISNDADGVNRIWEAFGSKQLDGVEDAGCPIPWVLETRAFTAGTVSPKQWRFAKLHMGELDGTVDMKVGWAGSRRGRYKEVLMKRIEATPGQITPDDDVPQTLFGTRPQSRVLLTQEQRSTNPDELSSCDVESELEEWRDTGFSLCIQASGPGGVRMIQVFMDPDSEATGGKCEEDEEGVRLVRFDGAGAHGDEIEETEELVSEDMVFVSSQTSVATQGDESFVGSGTASSTISQADADKQALAIAQMRAAHSLATQGETFLGGFSGS